MFSYTTLVIMIVSAISIVAILVEYTKLTPVHIIQFLVVLSLTTLFGSFILALIGDMII